MLHTPNISMEILKYFHISYRITGLPLWSTDEPYSRNLYHLTSAIYQQHHDLQTMPLVNIPYFYQHIVNMSTGILFSHPCNTKNYYTDDFLECCHSSECWNVLVSFFNKEFTMKSLIATSFILLIKTFTMLLPLVVPICSMLMNLDKQITDSLPIIQEVQECIRNKTTLFITLTSISLKLVVTAI